LLVPGSSIFFSLVNCQIGKKEIWLAFND
jgi:hypothetical protein